jgi:hypothetical protein
LTIVSDNRITIGTHRMITDDTYFVVSRFFQWLAAQLDLIRLECGTLVTLQIADNGNNNRYENYDVMSYIGTLFMRTGNGCVSTMVLVRWDTITIKIIVEAIGDLFFNGASGNICITKPYLEAVDVGNVTYLLCLPKWCCS